MSVDSSQSTHVVHRFVADHFPSPWDLHCWATQQTDKQPIPFKVLRNGKILGLVCPAQAIQPKTVEQASGKFAYLRTEPAPSFTAQAGDIASVSLRLSYSISRRNPEGKNYKQSPWDTFGRLQKSSRDHFMAYLEAQTGLEGLLDGTSEVELQVVALLSEEDRQRKVWLPSVADIGIRARVKDPLKFNNLAHVSIGNQRSYGFGSVALDLLEPALDQIPA